MSKREMGVVKSEQDKGIVKVMVMIFYVYSSATWRTSYAVICALYLLTHATSPFLLKISILQR